MKVGDTVLIRHHHKYGGGIGLVINMTNDPYGYVRCLCPDGKTWLFRQIQLEVIGEQGKD